MQDYPSKVNTNIERQTSGGFMVNELGILLLTLVGCFSLMLTGISQAKVEAVTQRAAPVAVGETAPDFTLEDQNGQKVSLSESRGKNPVVLAFYRGYW